MVSSVRIDSFFKNILFNEDSILPNNKIDSFLIEFSSLYVNANKMQKEILFPSALRLLRIYNLGEYV